MRPFSLVFLMGLTAAACGGSANSPMAPSPIGGTTQLTMTGTWVGTSADSTGGEQMA